MSEVDRRGATRFPLAEPAIGRLRLIQDVLVARVEEGQATVIAAAAIPRGERLLLEVHQKDGGGVSTLLVRAVRSRAVIGDGAWKRQVLLEFIRREGETEPAAALDLPASVTPSRPLVASLVRRVPVRIVDVSSSGCLFDSPVALEDGTVGFMDVTSHDLRRTEAIRTRRGLRTEGRVWPYRTGAQFLTLGPASPASLRGVAAIMTVGGQEDEPAGGEDAPGLEEAGRY